MSKTIVVNDDRQRRYKYRLTEPKGKKFDPGFKPDFSPKQMLRLGVFGGVYLDRRSGEFPRDWFSGVRFSPDGERNKKLNYFGVLASQPLAVWQKKGWIYRDDPRGWFQWYCRYYMGRRIPPEDERQIRRWRAMRRHVAQLERHCQEGDETCRPRQRQALLQWAYDSRKI